MFSRCHKMFVCKLVSGLIGDMGYQLPVLLGLAVGAGLGPPGAVVSEEAP